MHARRKFYFIALFFALFVLHAFLPSPAGGQEPAGKKQPDYSQEAVVLESLKNIHRFEKDGTGRHEMHLRVKVQSEAGVSAFGQLIFLYTAANEKLDVEYVGVRKPDGKVVTSSESNVQDLTAPISREAPVYTDLRQKHITVPGLRPGDTLEYRIVRHIVTPLARNHFWCAHYFLQGGMVVLDEQLEVNIPADTQVKLKTEAGRNPIVEESGGRRSYLWKNSYLKPTETGEKKEEKEAESDEPKPPHVQMTTFQSWNEVGQWYAPLQRERINPDERIRAKAAELIAGRATELEKIEALYNFVARNFRYVSLSFGQGRYQPHAASEVMANQYGDCKDKHTLLASLLQAAGMRAYPVLINSSRKVDPDFPSPGQFDHVITAIPLGKETIWVDTTTEVAPFRLLAETLRNKQALIIPDDGPARLEKTPADPPFPFSELVEVEGQVNELGELTGHAHLMLRGDTELYFRNFFRKVPKTEWKQFGFVFSALIGGEGEAAEVKVSDPAETEKPLTIDFDFSGPGYLDWSSKKLSLGLPLPAVSLPFVSEQKQESSEPIDLGAISEVSHRLKLTLPAKYKVRLPVPITVARDYGEYRSSYKLEGTTLIVERMLRLRQREIPASRAQDYQAFASSANADKQQTVALETELAGTPAIPETMKAEELIKSADVAVSNQNFSLAEQLLTRALEKEPKHKFVRRQLGFVLFAQQKYNRAIEVIREQTKINPFDDYAYNMLGRIYWAQQEYAEAAAAFRKHLEISPLDKWGHGNLGLLLVQWRKYQEAVPELEQAISLNPEMEPRYQIALGRAYANLGQAEKAVEAFDKAVRLMPDPGSWNDVAYYLTLANLQLDKAQQYAESAVTAASTQLRNVELANLRLEDLGIVSSLAAYWDTLGWVHFKKGNLDLAKRYVMAAWNLANHAEVGDHLGQIIEKGGNKDEAIRYYALAAVGDSPVPEPRENLLRLAGQDRIDSLLARAREELAAARVVKLGALLKNEKEKVEAEFYLLAVPGPSRSARIAEVRFIRGSEKLRPLAETLKSAAYPLTFPDESSTKLVLRGTLSCDPGNGACHFTIMNPGDIVSIE